MFSAFLWVRQPAVAECLISIEYYSELLNPASKNWEVPARGKYTDNFVFFYFHYNRYLFVVQGHPNVLTSDLVALNNTLSISHSPHPLAAGPVRNAENTESLLDIHRMLDSYLSSLFIIYVV